MKRSHLPSRKAKTSAHAPVGEPPETPRTSEDRVVEEPPSRRSPCPLRWADPAAARVWLERTRSAVDDLAALAREGGRRRKNRVLARAELRWQTHDTERVLRALFDDADAGLPAVEGAGTGLAGLTAAEGESGA